MSQLGSRGINGCTTSSRKNNNHCQSKNGAWVIRSFQLNSPPQSSGRSDIPLGSDIAGPPSWTFPKRIECSIPSGRSGETLKRPQRDNYRNSPGGINVGMLISLRAMFHVATLRRASNPSASSRASRKPALEIKLSTSNLATQHLLSKQDVFGVRRHAGNVCNLDQNQRDLVPQLRWRTQD